MIYLHNILVVHQSYMLNCIYIMLQNRQHIMETSSDEEDPYDFEAKYKSEYYYVST